MFTFKIVLESSKDTSESVGREIVNDGGSLSSVTVKSEGVTEAGSIGSLKLISKHGTSKPIAAFSCTPLVQEVHTKAEVLHLTPGLLGLVVVFNCHQ